MASGTVTQVATQTYRVWIKATPEAIWKALTDPRQIERYGYASRVDIDLKPGGTYRANATDEMIKFGAPAVMVEGEVVEVNAPTRLVHTWHALFDPQTSAEPPTKLTYEIEPALDGVTKLTVTHELDGAPLTAGTVGGVIVEAGGGWGWILSDLKTLLESGTPLPVQMRMPE